MQQLSRPYQIALVVLVLAAAAWFVAVGHHSSSSGGSSGSAPAPSAPAHASSQPSGGSAGSSTTKIYHGSAPGVEGLSKDIAKAHGAVGASESYEHHLEEKSANATAGNPSTAGSSSSSSSGSAAASGAAGATATHGSGTSTTPATVTAKAPATGTAKAPATHSTQSATSTHAQPTTKHATAPAHSTAPKSATRPAPVAVGAPLRQKEVEATVARGKTALVLFWNPAAANDRTVHGEVRSVAGKNRSSLALFEANAKEVAAFGGITRQVPVYGTPTLLIVGRGGHATSLVGLQDVFSIEQAIREVKSASA
ncbi:MAG TPA: hypothetical protein VMI13_13900 [Solirubrobacteraceae bacterium]|nr:hypothetical protein [Solirubrobacteraceae bacterium]